MSKISRGTGLYRNLISYFGSLLILLSLLLLFSSLVLLLTREKPSPYLGILIYMILPGFLLIGLFIFLFGMLRERRRRRLLGAVEALPLPVLDLNNRKQLAKLGAILVGGGFLAVLLSSLAYNAYQFTDSVAFCGKICHRVMEPEYTAYLNGPHARVPCVDCHVGPGVAWYLRSKVAGVPPGFNTLFQRYPTPLPSPVENLRPARETCEKCHWPEKFFGAQLIQIPHFRHDEKNTPEQISFLVKTGGGNPSLGGSAGIHWHMIISNRVYFKASDRQLQNIPWIRVVLPGGSETIYRDKNAKISGKELNELPTHTMDCMDCHNRPAHMFQRPETLVDRNMQNGNISPRLPWIKRRAVEVLIKKYGDRDKAGQEIRQALEEFYRKNYPDVLKQQKNLLDQAIETIDGIYGYSVFPDMKVDWFTYPANIGHRSWPGCYRCHDGQHVTESGKVLSHECTVCHTLPQRGPLQPLGGIPPVSWEPWHPWAQKGKHALLLCHTCHQKDYPSVWGCAECHNIDRSAPMMSMKCETCHLKEQEVHPLADCLACHREIRGLHRKPAHTSTPCHTCHLPHVWSVAERKTCLPCHEDKKDHYSPSFCGECHKFSGS